MYITREDVEAILAVMEKFPDAGGFYLKADSSSGIGTTIELTVATNINGLDGEFKVEISGVENW
jgi:hypothetical protein